MGCVSLMIPEPLWLENRSSGSVSSIPRCFNKGLTPSAIVIAGSFRRLIPAKIGDRRTLNLKGEPLYFGYSNILIALLSENILSRHLLMAWLNGLLCWLPKMPSLIGLA